jgi:hypothetical protein
MIPALVLLVTQEPVPRTVRVEPGFEVVAHRLGDFDGNGRAELVVVASDGRVRTFLPLAAEGSSGLGELTLPSPRHALLDLARWGDAAYLVVETPQGTLAHALDARGVVATEGSRWIPRARFGVRLSSPTFAPIAQDVNHDGIADVVVPTTGGVELWQAALEGKKTPSFHKVATLAVKVTRAARYATTELSDELTCSLTIPSLETEDVNGDGRPDLVVAEGQIRAWHLQKSDSSFPAEPDVRLDLATFRDTSPEPKTGFGTTATSGDDARLYSRDLDGDGIPDHVIQHRRKVWVFLGGAAGPQFTQPADVLRTAEDTTALILHPLDDDERPDLLFLKLQIPTVAALLGGFLGEWDIAIRALGYRNTGQGKFETSPGFSNDLALRLPSILQILRAPEKITQRFEDLGERFRGGARGDVDGDGTEDTLLVTSDRTALELWIGHARAASTSGEWLKTLLFGEKDTVFDLDRILGVFQGLADQRVAEATGGRPPDQRVALPDPKTTEVLGLECADLDGDGAREIVLACRERADMAHTWFEVLVFRAPR